MYFTIYINMYKSFVLSFIICIMHGYICKISPTTAQLIINVKNQGGDVVQETITANVTEDIVILEFQRPDGTLVTQLLDFKNEVEILKALILGEEERGQSHYQVVCFIFHFPKDAFISSDAMSKLRQKNPGTIRFPEEDRGRDNYTMSYSVNLTKSFIISPYISDFCSEAIDTSYIKYEDIQIWASVQGLPESTYLSALKKLPEIGIDDNTKTQESNNCVHLKSVWNACQCRLEICIGWYPCGLKYCKGKGETKSSAISYRCGIKTCRKCNLFSYYVPHKQLCLWDE